MPYPKQQLWEIYENLPEELREAIFSQETAENINKVCDQNQIGDKSNQVARLTGEVLMGLLAPDEFEDALETELDLNPEKAEKVCFQINRYIFRPVQSSLRVLYEETMEEKEGEKKEQPEKEDIYREPI